MSTSRIFFFLTSQNGTYIYIYITRNKVVSLAQCLPRRNYNTITKLSKQKEVSKIQNISRCSNKAMSLTTRYDNWNQE
jgi:N6-adenosine-specific RNA methylase IME4